jgi:hypothetical protein
MCKSEMVFMHVGSGGFGARTSWLEGFGRAALLCWAGIAIAVCVIYETAIGDDGCGCVPGVTNGSTWCASDRQLDSLVGDQST